MPRGQGIKPISQLFAKYNAITKAPSESVIKATCEVIADLLDITIDYKKLKYQPHQKIINLQFGGVLKSEIKLHKTEILRHLKGRLGEKNAPRDII